MLTRSRPNLSVSTVAPPARLRPRKGPESIVRAFEGIGAAWETEAFEVRDVLEQ